MYGSLPGSIEDKIAFIREAVKCHQLGPLTLYVPRFIPPRMVKFFRQVDVEIVEEDMVIGLRRGRIKTLKFFSKEDLALFVLMFNEPILTSVTLLEDNACSITLSIPIG